jgi:UDP-N-acetylglucosamine--N-acetylmuramyl-(pentapeptide) pyrophosphoryl-undecaprenol N-acetylglucosamine transferase
VKVLLTGGGTGGHITPLLAVASELKKQDKHTTVVYVGERNGKFGHLTSNSSSIDRIYTVYSGKFRRYHGQNWVFRLFDIPTNLKNLRDVFLVLMGTIQSILLLSKLKPDVVFLKGGFVGVPVGLAASLLRVPFITHDSDALPGLANRLVSRWAYKHATALPAAQYNYPQSKTEQVGVIVSSDYQPITHKQQKVYKKRLDIPDSAPLLLITGGSLGAERLNRGVVKLVDKLLDDYQDLHIVHQVGRGKSSVYGSYTHERLNVLEFLSPMFVYTGAADVVVTRAGANTVAELGVQGKACVIVPNPQLTGGHQLENAKNWKEQGVALVVAEKDMEEKLSSSIRKLLDNPKLRTELSEKIKNTTITDAAERLAHSLLNVKGSDATGQ